jgi:Ferritin-like domain
MFNQSLARMLIREIMNDEAAHVPILQGLLDDEENPLTPKIRPMPVLNMSNVVQPNFATFLETAAAFENTGSGTYGGALFAVQQTDEYFPTAVGLCTVESRHASFLNALLGDALVPNFAPVEAPIPQEITLSRVAPFVKDPVAEIPSFDPENASDENNFRILDFLLFLEYIEAAFYRINVPRFIK